jgi:hypothetical protein
MKLMSLGLIPLTVFSLFLIPNLSQLGVNPDSSTQASWVSSVQDNFYTPNGEIPDFHREFDFKQFSPNLSEIINDFVNTFNSMVVSAQDLLNNTINFFRDPFNLANNEAFNQALDLLKLNKLNSLTDAQSHWNSLELYQQQVYTLYVYPEMSWLIQWFYYSPTQLNA